MNRHARQLFYFGWGSFAPIFNPLAQAVQILAKYGGSLWVASPEYTFTGSDGTGAAGDGSDAGYGVDLCATYVTMGVPPTSGTSGWASLNSTLTVQGDALVITNSVGGAEGSGYASFAVKPNTSYAIALEVVAASNGGAVTIGNTRVGLGGVGVKGLILTTSTNGLFSLAVNSGVAGQLLSVRNVSVREIIGRPLFQATTGFKPKLRLISGRWAWVFDGVDDILSTASLPASTEETLIVCKDSVRKASGTGIYMSKRGGGFFGAWFYTDTNGDNGLTAGNGSSWQYNGSMPPGSTAKSVLSAVTSATQVKKRGNGVSTVNALAYASATGQVSVGGYASAFANSTVFAAAYAPAAIPDAELLIVEKAMAQLGGITI